MLSFDVAPSKLDRSTEEGGRVGAKVEEGGGGGVSATQGRRRGGRPRRREWRKREKGRVLGFRLAFYTWLLGQKVMNLLLFAFYLNSFSNWANSGL